MSIRDYSVIVNPEDWSGSVEDLARRLVPIVGQPSSQLVKRFTNGPMTVESDLTLQSAQALADRLETLGVTSRIQSENEEESIDVDDFEWDAADFDLDSMFSEVENLPGDSSAVFDEEVNPRQTQMGFSTAFAHDMARKPKAPELDAPKKEPSQPSGWGDIFPELEKPAEEQPETEQPKVTPTSKRVATSEIVTAPPAKQPEARPKVDPAKPTPPSLDELAGIGTPKHGTELARIKPVKRLVELPKPKAETTPAPAPPIEAPTIEPPPPVATRPVAPRPIAPQNPSMSAAAFMDELVGNEQSSLGPYAPVGFDDGYEHATPVATVLAVLAPGAGHVYNGADDKAIGIALKSILVKPWIDSIVEAREHAGKISTYHRPRPEKGSFRRALIHLGMFWFALGLLIVSVTFVLTRYVFHESEAENIRRVTPVDIRDAHANARMHVVQSRVEALGAMKEVLQETVTPTFSMSEQERVRRLYSVGVERCREKDYGSCAAIMKRVVKLDPLYRSALTLQTWSSEQLSSGAKKPMPDIGEVPSLSELEKSELLEDVPDLPTP